MGTDISADGGSAVQKEAGAVLHAGIRRHPGSGCLAATVIGGTYLDIELMVDNHIRSDVSMEVWNRSSSLGGPGFCYALELASLGIAVDLITRLGSCRSSSQARRILRENGISSAALAEVVDAELDIATLVIDPAGRKLAFNEHRLARTIDCDPSALRRDRALLVASPTPLGTILKAIRTCSQWGWRPEVFFAPHSRQLAEFALLPTSSRELLCSTIMVACLNAQDLTVDFEAALDERTVLVVTNGASGCAVRKDCEWGSFPAHSVHHPRLNTNGAGEAFFAGMVAALLRGTDTNTAIHMALETAARHLERLQSEALCEGGRGSTYRRGPLTAIGGETHVDG